MSESCARNVSLNLSTKPSCANFSRQAKALVDVKPFRLAYQSFQTQFDP